MALPVFFKVYARDHFGLLITLRKYNAYMLGVLRVAFKGVGGTWSCLYIAFAVVDGAVLHNVLHFRFGDLAAVHAAAGVFGIFKKCSSPVKAAVAVYFLCFFGGF